MQAIINVLLFGITLFFVAIFSVGCSGYLVSKEIGLSSPEPDSEALSLDNPKGIPWVESRKYRVYLYVRRQCSLGTECKHRSAQKHSQPCFDQIEYDQRDADLISFQVISLSDKVNGNIIDQNRKRWMVNYQTLPFASGELQLEFHPSGSLKKAGFTGETGADDAAQSVKEAVSFEKQRLTEKKELLELKNAINKAEQEAAGATTD